MSENNIKKLLRGLLQPTQEIEDALQQLLLERGVDTAVGDQLDVLGRLVGQDRGGMSDDDFRRLVRARISVNRSKGAIADILRVTDLIVNDPLASLVVDNQGTACFVIRIEDQPLADAVASLLIPFLREATAGGVRVILEWSPLPVAQWLRFDIGHLDTEHMITATDGLPVIPTTPVLFRDYEELQGFTGTLWPGRTGFRLQRILVHGSPGGFRD